MRPTWRWRDRLAAAADVVVENFKVGGLVRFGLDHASVAAANSGVIYASITGFGQDGPLAARPGYDFIIQAMGGIMDLTGEPDGPPQKPGVAHADLFTGLYGTVAVLAALRQRDRTGQGQWIDLGLFDVQLAVLANQAANFLIGGSCRGGWATRIRISCRIRCSTAVDGPLVIACGNDGQFARLCAGLGLGLHRMRGWRPIRAGWRTATRWSARSRRGSGRMARAEVLAAAEAGGVPAGPINTVAEALAEPQAAARGAVTAFGVRSPIRFSGAEIGVEAGPPRLDADGGAIRAALAAGEGWPE